MRILMVASEVKPLAKAGGLADVIASLSRALAGLGHDVRCAIPRYRSVEEALPGGARERGGIEVGLARLSVVEADSLPVPVVLVAHPLFDRPGIYDDPATRRGYPDNGTRWAVFCRAVHAALGADGWVPEVVHGHDHQAGPLMALLRWTPLPPAMSGRPGTVFTIHNLEYQGVQDPSWLAVSGLPAHLFRSMGPLEFHGRVNLMKAGIEGADRLTTVSPRYAREIRTPEFGAGLEGVLAARASRLTGILNGIDTDEWDPSMDSHIPFRYTAAKFSRKSRNRAALCEELGLSPPEDRAPLLGMVGRMTSQKGLDLVLPVLDAILDDGIRMVVLGSGEARYESALAEAARGRPGLAVRVGFDEGLAHRIEAGADAFLMPSRYEPCGLNQMYSLRYGTVPLVRAVGGLADTVVDLDEDPPRANGFVFRLYEAIELLKTVRRAGRAFRDRTLWKRLAIRGMETNSSWEISARQYAELYRQTVEDPAGIQVG